MISAELKFAVERFIREHWISDDLDDGCLYSPGASPRSVSTGVSKTRRPAFSFPSFWGEKDEERIPLTGRSPKVSKPVSGEAGTTAAARSDRKTDPDLDTRLKYLDESFAQMLIRKIDESGMKDSDCYNAAHINRALFNKIKNDPYYRTSKPTVIAFGLALRLDGLEFEELLTKAGYALSPASKFDVIIDFCVRNRIYDIMEVNEILYEYDQQLLGAQ